MLYHIDIWHCYANEVMTKLSNVDFIMVRDGLLDGVTDYEQIHAQLHNDDVDFYKYMERT